MLKSGGPLGQAGRTHPNSFGVEAGGTIVLATIDRRVGKTPFGTA